jgi:hypothetical protein
MTLIWFDGRQKAALASSTRCAIRHPCFETPAPPAGVAVLRAEETRRTAAMSV